MRYEELHNSLIIGPGLGVRYAFVVPLDRFQMPDLWRGIEAKLARFEWGRLVSGFLYTADECRKYQKLLGWEPVIVGVGSLERFPAEGPDFDSGLVLQLHEMDRFIRGFRVR